jgi:cation/acetate symporter
VNKNPADWWLGISPEGIGFAFMWLALIVGVGVSLLTPAPPRAVQQLVEDIRIPGSQNSEEIDL